MGKKSVMDPPLLSSEERQGVDALEVSLPAEQSTLTELFHQFLRVNTQERSMTNPVSTTNYQTVFFDAQNDKQSILKLVLVFSVSGGRVDEDYRKLHPKQKVIQRMSGSHEHGSEVTWPHGLKKNTLDTVYCLLLIMIVITCNCHTVRVPSEMHVKVFFHLF